MRVILNQPPRTPSAFLRKQLNWTALAQRRQNHMLSQVHQCLIGRAPQYLRDKFVRNSCFYSCTRGANNLHIPQPRTNMLKYLRWHSHIDNMRRTCLCKIAATRRASSYLPCHIRRMLYLSFVLLHFEYCSVVWHHCGTALTSRLEGVQNYALRVILKKPPRSDTEEMRSQLNLLSLSRRREISMILSQVEGKLA